MADIVMVHRHIRQAVDEDGVAHPIIMFFDADGEETLDPDLALSAVAKTPTSFIAIDLSKFERAQTQ